MNQEMTLQLFRDTEENNHFHPDMEVIYVIEGNVDVTIREWEYRLGKNDVILVNSGIEHSLSCREHAIFCAVWYSPGLTAKLADSGNLYFHCCSVSDGSSSYDSIRQIFRNLILNEMDESKKGRCIRQSLLYRLLGE